MFSLRIIALAAMAMLFAACGGGGGNTDGDVLVGKQATFTIAGTVSGLTVLQGQPNPVVEIRNVSATTSAITSLSVSGNSSFTFPAVVSGTAYNLAVTSPAGYSCVFSTPNNNSVVGNAAVTDINITCVAGQHSVGGAIAGLGVNNPSVQLMLIASSQSTPITLSNDGPFAFSRTLVTGTAYEVRMVANHNHYSCSLRNANGDVVTAITGNIDATDVQNIAVTCDAPIHVTVSGLGPNNAGLTLANSYSIDASNNTQTVEFLPIAGDGSFVFPTRLPFGRTYNVSISGAGHLDYACTVSSGSGSVGSVVINVMVSCSERTYVIGGTVTGLGNQSTGLMLRRDAVAGRVSEEVTILPNAPSFSFSTGLPTGVTVSLAEASEPDDRVCVFANGMNSTAVTIDRAAITNILVNCSTPAALVVNSAMPASSAVNVPLNTHPQIVFSTALNAATVNASTVSLSTPQGVHQLSNLQVSGNTLTVRPLGKLAPSTTYTLTATTGLRGGGKERLAANFIATFTTNSGWSAPQDSFGVAATMVGQPYIQFDASGRALLLVPEHVESQGEFLPEFATTLMYRRCEFVSGLCAWSGPEVLFSDTPAITGYGASSHVTSDPNGNVMVLFRSWEGAFYDRHYSFGSWGASRAILSGHNGIVTGLDVTADQVGNAWLAYSWYSSASMLSFSRYTANAVDWNAGAWSNSENIVAPIANVLNESPRIAANQTGNALTTWVQTTAGSISLLSSAFSAGWSVPTVVSDNSRGNSISESKIVMDSNGNAVAVWVQGTVSANNLYARRYLANVGWEATIHPVQLGAGSVSQLQLALDASGVVTAVWRRHEGSFANIHAARMINGTWGASRALQTSATYAQQPRLAMDEDGSALALWLHLDGSHLNVYASRFTIGTQSWSSAHRIDTGTGDASGHAVAIDPSGNGLAVWLKNQRMYVSRFE
jgi:hypothetical protein